MKKTNLFLLVCTIFCTQLMMAQDYHWPLTADLNDVKGGKNGTNSGVTFQNDEVRGNVASFDGNSFAKLPSFIKGNAAITVAIWWRMDEVRPWSRVYSFGKGDQSEPKDVMMVIPVNGAAAPVQNFYRFTLSDPAGPWVDADIDPAELNIQVNQWNYSVVVIKDDSIIFYHNDQQIFAEGGFTRKIETLDDTENALGKSFWPDQLWKGALSDLRVYKTGLSKTEVVALYNATKANKSGVRSVDAENEPGISVNGNQIKITLKQNDQSAMANIYSITGQQIMRESVNKINNTYLQNGMYLIQIETNNASYSKKVMIQ